MFGEGVREVGVKEVPFFIYIFAGIQRKYFLGTCSSIAKTRLNGSSKKITLRRKNLK